MVFDGATVAASSASTPTSARARLGFISTIRIQGYMNRRAQAAVGKGGESILLVATVFAMLHLPNPALTVLTLLGGLIWATIYQREANLFALAASHTVASISLAIALPLNVINGLRVGFKYFG